MRYLLIATGNSPKPWIFQHPLNLSAKHTPAALWRQSQIALDFFGAIAIAFSPRFYKPGTRQALSRGIVKSTKTS
jgi:hypothetical protein